MISTVQISNLLRKYMTLFPEEKGNAGLFADFLSNPAGDPFSRKNFSGHFTASVFIGNPKLENFLLLRHRGLGRWLQPGGHVEAGDADMLAAALREAAEETGFYRDMFDLMCTAEGFPLIDIDSHPIPSNAAKQEAGHFHHDIRFLLRLRGDGGNIRIAAGESDGFKWVGAAEFAGTLDAERLLAKLPLFTNAQPLE